MTGHRVGTPDAELPSAAMLAALAEDNSPRCDKLRDIQQTLRADLSRAQGEALPSYRSVAVSDDREVLVSVVMPVWNNASDVERAIDSVLDQTHRKIELIVVDDASTDGTRQLVADREKLDTRIRLFTSHRNRGPYWCKNLGIMQARGEFVALHDADDESDPRRLEEQLRALRARAGAVACYTLGQRVDRAGTVVLQRGRAARLCYPTLLFDREYVLSRVGAFDCVRYAADDEFHCRLKARLPTAAVLCVDKVLYTLLVRDDSLTAVDTVALEKASGPDLDPLAHLSSVRRQYVHAYRNWHRSAPRARVVFPPRAAPFEVPAVMAPEPTRSWQVSASVASIPSRELGLRQIVTALLPQVDQLNVYLNNYALVPDFLDHPRIVVARSQDHGDRADNGKFFFLDQIPDGYHLTVDDDIVYPRGYVAYCVAKCQQYDDRAAIGFHGTIFGEHLVRFFDAGTRTTFSFRQGLDRDEQVHLLGTGTVAHPTGLLALDDDSFPTTRMADIWFAVAAQRQSVPLIAVPRQPLYLDELKFFQTGSLYHRYRNDDHVQTSVAKRCQPWQMPELATAGHAG